MRDNIDVLPDFVRHVLLIYRHETTENTLFTFSELERNWVVLCTLSEGVSKFRFVMTKQFFGRELRVAFSLFRVSNNQIPSPVTGGKTGE